MRHYSKYHGSHCYLRSFQTSCPKCGVDVLYWECTHGSKVFFQYPPYGKLIKHYCRTISNQFKQKEKVVIKKPNFTLEALFFNCPICGKPFKNLENLKDHFRQRKKIDLEHKLFFADQLRFMDDVINFSKKTHKQVNSKNQPKFGRINIKKTENNNR
ncbi:MAG: hypothetical protein ACFFEO_02650 [Candidatus Thorarchaeota archaeon]